MFIIEEKLYWVCNYVLLLCEGLFNLVVVVGIDLLMKFLKKYVVFKNSSG